MKNALIVAFVVSLLISLLSASFLNTDAQTLPAQNTWSTKAQMHFERGDLGVAVVDGKIYAIGGTTKPSQFDPTAHTTLPFFTPAEFTAANEEYDPATNTWTIKAEMPISRSNFATAVVDGKIYCLSGKSENKLSYQHRNL
jgi:hypothetical protein